MRQARLKAPLGTPLAYYHCVSRVVDRAFVLGPEEKEVFVSLMRRWERFCGVRAVTYCIMSNHFHLLVEVPARPVTLPSSEELFSRLRALYSPSQVAVLREQRQAVAQSADSEAVARWEEQFLRRMWDVSLFMKALKQQFTQWFNHRHARRGTLWEERFRSVLVEGADLALARLSLLEQKSSYFRAVFAREPA